MDSDFAGKRNRAQRSSWWNPILGLRCSDHPFIRALMQQYEKPVVYTSANKSGQPVASSYEEVEALDLDLFYCSLASAKEQVPSTVIKI
ncbi:MAG: Sua5/YciO/YrdC/YwlC family protein [Bdellovibrionales bacterium]